jgi:hypothetical protein
MHWIAHLFWSVFDYVFLLQMGRAYRSRFREFSHSSHDVSKWRQQQQKEWDRLSTAVRAQVITIVTLANTALLPDSLRCLPQ